MKLISLVGHTYGRLLVLTLLGRPPAGRPSYLCQCECGKTTAATSNMLRSGNTRSCGCLRSNAMKEKMTTHGLQPYPEYSVWSKMKQRCANPKDKAYKYYGGRGITVHPLWENSFELFISDMGRRPTAKHSIDRVDNNRGYEPGNCRWATRAEQMRNYSRNVVVTYQGLTKTVVDWATYLGVSYSALTSRFYRGWDAERAFTQPYRGGRI